MSFHDWLILEETESSLHCCVTMKLVYKQVSFPSLFVSLLSLRNNLFTCQPSCTCFLFSVSFLYFPFSISCNTTLHTHLHLRTCLSVAQTGYPPPWPIHNTDPPSQPYLIVSWCHWSIAHPLKPYPAQSGQRWLVQTHHRFKIPTKSHPLAQSRHSRIATKSSIHNPKAAAERNQTYVKPSLRSTVIWHTHSNHQKF